MKIANALKQISLFRSTMADDENALQTARRSLQEWRELEEECGRVAIRGREDLFELVRKHIRRIEHDN